MAPQPSTVVSPLTPPHRVTEPIHLTASTRPHTAESNPTRPQTVRRLHAPHSRRSSGHPPTQVTAVRNQMGMARSKMAYSWQVGTASTGRWPLRAARTCRDIAATSLIWSSHIRFTVVDFQIPSYPVICRRQYRARSRLTLSNNAIGGLLTLVMVFIALLCCVGMKVVQQRRQQQGEDPYKVTPAAEDDFRPRDDEEKEDEGEDEDEEEQDVAPPAAS